MKHFELIIGLLVWQMRYFFDAKGAAEFLNTLPEALAVEAKVSCSSDGSCFVIFRDEREAKVDPMEIR